MRVLYVFDEDGKYGGPKAGIEMISILRKKYEIEPIVLTSKYNEVNEYCDNNDIYNLVTYHHKYTYVKSTSFIKNFFKIFPRFLRYKIGNILALNIIRKNIDMNTIDMIHTNISGIDLGILLGKKYCIPNIMHIREYGEGESNFRVKSYRRRYVEFLNKKVTKFVCISNTVTNFWIAKGIDEDKIVKIYDGLYLDNIKADNKHNKHNKLKFIMLGSIHPRKRTKRIN